MGNKKSQAHVQQSMGQMVGKAALAQMGPQIEQLVQQHIQHLGSQLATQTANTMQSLFSRIVVLENLLIEKLGVTKADIVSRVSDLEDSKEGLESVQGSVEVGDVVRIKIETKAKDQAEYQGASLLKIYKSGSGETLGKELEDALIGMSKDETKVVEFGQDKQMLAQITVSRIARPIKTEETSNESTDQTQG